MHHQSKQKKYFTFKDERFQPYLNNYFFKNFKDWLLFIFKI